MKKLILFLSVFTGLIFSASAQLCTPDTTHFASGKYVYPDSLPCIFRHQAFTGKVSLMVPDSLDAHDFVSAAPAGFYYFHIDSMRIDSISGYPGGLTAVTNPHYGVWLHAGAYGCVTVSGTTTDPAGSYQLNIYGRGCGHGTFPVYGTVDSCMTGNLGSFLKYTLQVCNATGVTSLGDNVSLDIYPNPSQGIFTVTVSAADHISGAMSVIDQLGRTIYTKPVDISGTRQIAVDLGNISPGTYLLMINADGNRSLKQFIVK
jgi:hypothetical protein